MLVVVPMRRDVVATLTSDKMNKKEAEGNFYHKLLERKKP